MIVPGRGEADGKLMSPAGNENLTQARLGCGHCGQGVLSTATATNPCRGGDSRETQFFCPLFCANHERCCLKSDDDRMNFALRRRPPLPSGWALTGRYPRARYISPQPTPGSTRTVSSSFPPLPKNLPEPPAYPCPHLSDFDVLKPLYQRNWKVCTSYNNASDVKKVALEKKFMLKKYQPTLEFFNEVMGLQGICAQEKVGLF